MFCNKSLSGKLFLKTPSVDCLLIKPSLSAHWSVASLKLNFHLILLRTESRKWNHTKRIKSSAPFCFIVAPARRKKGIKQVFTFFWKWINGRGELFACSGRLHGIGGTCRLSLAWMFIVNLKSFGNFFKNTFLGFFLIFPKKLPANLNAKPKLDHFIARKI